jgi:hypothetical protein
MIRSLIAVPLNNIRSYLRDRQTIRHAERIGRRHQWQRLGDFEFEELRTKVFSFVDEMRADESGLRFRYSASCRVATLYASTYACMTYGLLGRLQDFSSIQRRQWIDYFDSFQNAEDGLFYDPIVMNDIFSDTDWWGARHLALHMISAYTHLGGRPRYPFKFLSPYYEGDYIKNWLDAQDWKTNAIGLGDIDNKIMNVGCLLQYQRDQWADSLAGDAVSYMKEYLLQKINPGTGLWGGFNIEDSVQRSRMVQFAYDILPLYFYDGFFDFDHDRIVDLVLRTQNRIGGFGVRLNSSACEDIDSIDMLVRFAPYVGEQRKADIAAALSRACRWVLCNRSVDGGFQFRLFEPLVYGHRETSSLRNEGAMFPTWFRTLSLAYLGRHFSNSSAFAITRCPGCEF